MNLIHVRLVSLTAMVCVSACVNSAPAQLAGIHVQRMGSSPYFLQAAQATLERSRAQCSLLQSVCAMMPAGASAKDRAACIPVANGFSLRGNLADVGRQVTDEYFATGMGMATRKTRKTVLKVHSVCNIEVAEQNSTNIWHYTSQGYTQFESKDLPNQKRSWTRSQHKRVATGTSRLLDGVLPLTSRSTVSPPSGFQTHAKHKCALRSISGPWSGTLCLKATATPFPGHLTLAGKIVAGKTVMLEDAATEVAEGIRVPDAMFYPPADEIAEARSTRTPATNATQKWCLKQKQKTGVNPCENDSDDDQDQ